VSRSGARIPRAERDCLERSETSCLVERSEDPSSGVRLPLSEARTCLSSNGTRITWRRGQGLYRARRRARENRCLPSVSENRRCRRQGKTAEEIRRACHLLLLTISIKGIDGRAEDVLRWPRACGERSAVFPSDELSAIGDFHLSFGVPDPLVSGLCLNRRSR
jgi:hypothetical protein